MELKGSFILEPAAPYTRLLDAQVGEPSLPPNVDEVVAEMSMLCGSNISHALASLCGISPVLLLDLSDPSNLPQLAPQPNFNSSLLEQNSEVCWHIVEGCASSLNSISRMVLLCVRHPSLLRRMLSAHCALTQTAAVLQMVQARDLCFSTLCDIAAPQPYQSRILVSPQGKPPATPASEGDGSHASKSKEEEHGGETTETVVREEEMAEERVLAIESLLLLVFELASSLHESWGKILPVFQYLQTEISECEEVCQLLEKRRKAKALEETGVKEDHDVKEVEDSGKKNFFGRKKTKVKNPAPSSSAAAAGAQSQPARGTFATIDSVRGQGSDEARENWNNGNSTAFQQ
uniref:Uncharacterized protein n=1 Tax=Guillardia theta TaxID=55529 RepID=A0A6U5XLL4_GUITH